jgi:orotidine-5'-phosphate decarboxylase
MTAKERLIVALDVDTAERAEELVDMLAPAVDVFKVGIAPFTGFGERVMEKIEAAGKKVFLDLKFHDIPNTVRNAAEAAAKKNVFMMNFHCIGGEKMLRAAAEGVEKAGKRKDTLLIGVTVLTSMGREDLRALGIEGDIERRVISLAGMAQNAGLDGVVASGKEARGIKEKMGKDFIVVTPGVRPEGAATGDQKRALTPRAAVAEGADYIVVGRPIIEAADPVKAAARIIKEMEA